MFLRSCRVICDSYRSDVILLIVLFVECSAKLPSMTSSKVVSEIVYYFFIPHLFKIGSGYIVAQSLGQIFEIVLTDTIQVKCPIFSR